MTYEEYSKLSRDEQLLASARILAGVIAVSDEGLERGDGEADRFQSMVYRAVLAQAQKEGADQVYEFREDPGSYDAND